MSSWGLLDGCERPGGRRSLKIYRTLVSAQHGDLGDHRGAKRTEGLSQWRASERAVQRLVKGEVGKIIQFFFKYFGVS